MKWQFEEEGQKCHTRRNIKYLWKNVIDIQHRKKNVEREEMNRVESEKYRMNVE